MDTEGEKQRVEGTEKAALACIHRVCTTASGKLLCNTGRSAWRSAMTQRAGAWCGE